MISIQKRIISFVFYSLKGQSEIKSLKREREQLRREIWTLRDEYDKLENLLRTKGIDPDEFLNSNQDKNDDAEEENLSECSECSCESCCEDECCANEKSDQVSSSSVEKSNEQVNNTDHEEASSSSHDTKTAVDEHSKRMGKDRLNVRHHVNYLGYINRIIITILY